MYTSIRHWAICNLANRSSPACGPADANEKMNNFSTTPAHLAHTHQPIAQAILCSIRSSTDVTTTLKNALGIIYLSTNQGGRSSGVRPTKGGRGGRNQGAGRHLPRLELATTCPGRAARQLPGSSQQLHTAAAEQQVASAGEHPPSPNAWPDAASAQHARDEAGQAPTTATAAAPPHRRGQRPVTPTVWLSKTYHPPLILSDRSQGGWSFRMPGANK
jgi:hypothetical protein